MRLHLLLFISSFLAVCMFFSCEQDSEAEEYLLQAKGMMLTNPDSALYFIKCIENPEQLGRSTYMNYLLHKTYAKYKCFHSIAEDSAVFTTIKHFKDRKPADAALAYYCSGCVYWEQNNMDKALDHYLHALSYTEKLSNDHLIGNIQKQIGDLYYNENLPDSAIVHYKKAFRHLAKEKSDKPKMHIIRFIASSFMVKQVFDSAAIYNAKGLKIARQNNDSLFQYFFLYNEGIAYLEDSINRNPQKAKELMLASMIYNIDSLNITTGYADISRSYTYLNQLDSANYYADKALLGLKDETDNYVFLSAYTSLAELREKEQNYKEAWKYRVLYNKYWGEIIDKERAKDLFEVERKYKLSEKEKQIVEMQMREQFYFWTIIATILSLTVALLIIKYVRSKNQYIKSLNVQISDKNALLSERNKLLSEKNSLLDHQVGNMKFGIDIYKILTVGLTFFEQELEAQITSFMVKDKDKSKSKGYERILSSFKKMKKESLDKVYGLAREFAGSIGLDKNIVEGLNAAEVLLLALIYCQYETKDIANILGISTHALTMRKQRLKLKLKNLGLSDEDNDKLIP